MLLKNLNRCLPLIAVAILATFSGCLSLGHRSKPGTASCAAFQPAPVNLDPSEGLGRDSDPASMALKSPSFRETLQSDATSSKSDKTPFNQPASSANPSESLTAASMPEESGSTSQVSGTVIRGQSQDNFSNHQVSQAAGSSATDGSSVQPAAYQYPELSTQGNVVPSFGVPSPDIGNPSEYNPLQFPQNYADLDIYVQETQTGRIQFGGAYNSDNGLVGQFIIDERNFDLFRFPRSTQDIWDNTAWRGGGQSFRLELVPGTVLQRYMVSISEPYFLNTDWSASASGYYFDRLYFDWSERRLGGRLGLGRRIDQDISITAGLRMENVSLRNPRVDTSTVLNDSLGKSNLFLGSIGLIRDTRDNQFLATAGDFFSATFSQAFGDHTFSRGDLDYRRYRLLYERPDGSGRHTISMGTRLGISGSGTPIFENYFAGGFASLRGFEFRGVGPVDGDVRIGGRFEWINTVEYLFPITADDMIKGVMFVDFGTVDESVKLRSENFRVAPGVGLRVHMPAFGAAPLAFDFGFPVALADGDEKRIFSFYIGAMR